MVTVLEAVVIDNATHKVVTVGVVNFFVGKQKVCSDVSVASGSPICDATMPAGKAVATADYLGTSKFDPSSGTTNLGGIPSIEFTCTTTTCTPYHNPPAIPPKTTIPLPHGCASSALCAIPSATVVRLIPSLRHPRPHERACTATVVIHHTTTAEKAYFALLLVLLIAMGVLGWMIWSDKRKLTASEAAEVLDGKIL